jgi:hypothetical protein
MIDADRRAGNSIPEQTLGMNPSIPVEALLTKNQLHCQALEAIFNLK